MKPPDYFCSLAVTPELARGLNNLSLTLGAYGSYSW